jgi:putative transposase
MPKTTRPEDRAVAVLEVALHRSKAIGFLAAKHRLTILEVDEAAKSLGLSRPHLYRLLARFRQRPRSSTLLPKAGGRKPGSRLLKPQIELVVENAIRSFYLQRLKPSLSALVRQVQADCHSAGLKAPDRKTIHARVLAVDERELVASRQGPKMARERYDPVRHSPSIAKALEQVQIDHTPVDLIVVDERDRKPIGRPWLTLAIDVASRMVCGFYLSMMPPSTVSVAMALTHCVAPKDLWLADREITFEWPLNGLPDLVYMDNAKEFRTEALRSAAEEYGIALDYRPPRSAELRRPH